MPFLCYLGVRLCRPQLDAPRSTFGCTSLQPILFVPPIEVSASVSANEHITSMVDPWNAGVMRLAGADSGQVADCDCVHFTPESIVGFSDVWMSGWFSPSSSSGFSPAEIVL